MPDRTPRSSRTPSSRTPSSRTPSSTGSASRAPSSPSQEAPREVLDRRARTGSEVTDGAEATGPTSAGGTRDADGTRGTDGEEGTGRRRLWSALVRPGKAQVAVGGLLAVLGFAFVVQVQDNQRDDVYAGLRESELIQVLDGLTGTAERARGEVERLEERRDDLQSETNAREAALAEAEQRARTLNILAGLVPVTGPGVRMTVEEVDGRVSVGSLLDAVQELRTAGAEALEINDQHRLVASSSFDNGVGGIEVDGVLVEPPYVIEAIGEPHALRSGLEFQSGPVDTLRTFDGAAVVVEELESVDIESVAEPERTTYAESDEGQ